MTRINKKSLIVLTITALMLLCFVVSMIGLQNSGVVSAATYDNATDVQKAIDGFMANGKAPTNRNTTGTAIGNADQLKNFLTNGSTTRGYLTGPINNFSWDGAFTNKSTSANWTELDGNGYTITLNATSFGSSPARVKEELNDNEAIRYTYAGTKNTSSDIDVYGGLIGYLRSGQTIKNCNFVFGNYITATESTNKISSANSGTLGLIAGFSLGTIDNCSVTIKGSLNMEIYSSAKGVSTVFETSQETMSRHSFAAGGFVGTMSTSAVIKNSKIIHNGTMSFMRDGDMTGGTGWQDGYVRVWVGGIVGWMANGSQVFNVTTEGNGALTASYGSKGGQHQRTFSGIVAGCAGADLTAEEDTVSGYIQSMGVINGVINNWEGVATYSNSDSGLSYSPTGVSTTKSQYLVVGLAGRLEHPTSNVYNIFMNKDVYKGTVYSIGCDYSSVKKDGNYNGRQYSTNILTQDLLGREDGSEDYKDADYEHVSLIFAGTTISSPVWAVYDLKGESGILWSKTIEDLTDSSSQATYYFDKATSIEDAKKFDLTYTEIERNQGHNLKIKYAHGKAVYFTKTYTDGWQTQEGTNNIELPYVRYGAGLTAPKLNLYYDSEHTRPITTLEDKSYWMSISSSNNVMVRMTENAGTPDVYRSFLYMESSSGKDYSYIQFANETFRYVSYIYDDPIYKEYKKNHPNYEPVKNGEKQIDWQQRIIQEIKPKIVTVNFANDSDVKKDKGNQKDPNQNIISYGTYSTTYDGDPVTFGVSISSSDLKGEDCSANYEYRMYDSVSDTYSKVDSCVNAGTYKLVITGLTNGNFEVAGVGIVDYCIDFIIKPREIGFIISDNMPFEEVGKDTYKVKVKYQARDITLADEVDICPDEASAKLSKSDIVLYNVLAKDKDIIKFDYVAYGDNELDMFNVGTFEMRMSILSGINSSNYIMPEVTKYIVEIEPAEVTLSSKDSFSYSYGYFLSAKVGQEVKINGLTNDDVKLTFNNSLTTYKKQNDDGSWSDFEDEPFDVGVYDVTYVFDGVFNPNYSRKEITVRVTINPRTVGVTFADGNNTIRKTYGESVIGGEKGDISVSLQKQKGDAGIIILDYAAARTRVSFEKLKDQGNDTWIPTGEIVTNATDVGRYEVKVELFFEVGSTPGWEITEETYKNYEVEVQGRLVVINQRDVTIAIKDVERVYGEELPVFRGDAFEDDSVRAWSYVGESATEESYQFLSEDNIVILPYLSNDDIFASVGKYTVMHSNDKAHMSDKAHLDDPDLATFNKIDNYNISVVKEEGLNAIYTINKRTVKVKVFLNTNSVIYGDELPLYDRFEVISEYDFFEHDGIELEPNWYDVKKGSPKGEYYVGMNILNNTDGNYALEVEEAMFKIEPKTLTIIGATAQGEMQVTFDGEIHKPTVVPTFAEEIDPSEANSIEFNYRYFEIVNGVTSTEATESPWNVGQYRVFIGDITNPNYTVVFGTNYQRGSVIMTISKREVHIESLPGYRIYSVEGSLTPILRGAIHEEEGYHYLTREEVETNEEYAQYRDKLNMPYNYVDVSFDDMDHQFVQTNEQLQASMYIDEFYKTLGVERGVVKLRFDGLVKDEFSIGEDGQWSIGEIDNDGVVTLNGYRNYTIYIKFGDLHVIGANLEDVERYVSLRSYSQVYNGQDRFNDFRVVTSNENIANALKFSIFKYVAISTLSKVEADTLAAQNGGKGGKYVQSEVDGKLVYERDDANGTYVRKFLRRTEYGDSVSDKIVDAGQYFVFVEPADEDADIFNGYSDRVSFSIEKAVRRVSTSDISVSISYDKITLSSKIEGMEISFNGDAYINRNTFAGLTPNTSYAVKVRFAETSNYLQSEEITLNLRTSVDITSIRSTLAKYDKIDFSNIDEYESKVLAFIGSVSQEDMARIDQVKLAQLQASYEQLLRGANSVVADAQKVGATAVGKSGKTASAGKTVALSMSGLSMLAMGLMFVAKKKKDDEQDKEEVKTMKKVNVKRMSKMLILVVAVALVCVMVFAGCVPTDDGFGRADLYKIASFQADSQKGNCNLTIEVKSSGKSLYKYENGKETIDDRLDVSSMQFGADGIGFTFDDLYFTNPQFELKEDVATFNADIRESFMFMGINNAQNGKVSVSVTPSKNRLETIDVSYDIVNSGITYNVTVNVVVKY